MRRATLLILAVALATPVGGRADEPACGPPRCVQHEVTVDSYTFRFNVLLPPDYDSFDRRYPVLYLFMGGVGGDVGRQNRDSWLLGTDIEGYTQSLSPDEQAIVVLPDPGAVVDSRDGTMKWESFHVHTLIPFVDRHYRTIADGRHRAIAGLSWGAFAAAHHAARHPDLYAAVGTFSGAPLHLNDPAWLAAVQAGFLGMHVLCPAFGGANDGWLCGGYNPPAGAPLGPLGPTATDEIWWRANDPSELAGNLGGVGVFIGAGNGVPCDAEDQETLATGGNLEDGSMVYFKIESGAMPQAGAFSAALTRAGVSHHTDLRACGLHSWRYFWGDLLSFWPKMLAAFGTQPPRSFDFRLPIRASRSTGGRSKQVLRGLGNSCTSPTPRAAASALRGREPRA